MVTPCKPRPRPVEITTEELRHIALETLRASPEPVGVTVVYDAVRARCGNATPLYGDEHRLSVNDVRRVLDSLTTRRLARFVPNERHDIMRAKWAAVAAVAAE